jgi:hypothetical protein
LFVRVAISVRRTRLKGCVSQAKDLRLEVGVDSGITLSNAPLRSDVTREENKRLGCVGASLLLFREESYGCSFSEMS